MPEKMLHKYIEIFIHSFILVTLKLQKLQLRHICISKDHHHITQLNFNNRFLKCLKIFLKYLHQFYFGKMMNNLFRLVSTLYYIKWQ